MDNKVYQVGVAAADITPPVGIRLIGYTVRDGMSRGVDEALTATVLVVRGLGTPASSASARPSPGATPSSTKAHQGCLLKRFRQDLQSSA